MDFRRSTGLLYARIRRTSGVNHIVLASHPQANAGGEFDFHRPGTRGHRWGFHLHKLAFAPLRPPLAPLPLLKGAVRKPFLLAKLATAQPTLPIAHNNFAPLGCTPLHMAVTRQLHTFLLIERFRFPRPVWNGCAYHARLFLGGKNAVESPLTLRHPRDFLFPV